MKRGLFLAVVLAVLCGGAVAKDWGLDDAISAMADAIKASPNVGKWKKIVLVGSADSVEAPNYIETQNYIEEELTNRLVDHFTVIDRKNLGILREELEFQRSGKVDKAAIKRIGSVSGADFVFRVTLRNGELVVQADKVQAAVTSFNKSFSIKKNDNVLKELEKSTSDATTESDPKLPKIEAAVAAAVPHLTKRILESKGGAQKVLIYDIMADREDLSKFVHERIVKILANMPDTSIELITNRDQLTLIEAEMDFQASGEVDVNTAKERGRWRGAHAVIYGNIRPLGGGHRLFLYAINIENGKFIATHSQMIKGEWGEKKIPVAVPKKISGLKAEPISSDKVRISWSASDARNFIITRSAERGGAKPQHFYTGAKVALDFNLESETEYCYTVQPKNTAGLGDASEPVCAKTYGKPKPSREHKILVKEKTEKSVTLSWGKVREASHYNISRCLEQNQRCVKIASGLRDTRYKDTSNLQSSTRYTYSVDAVNSAGASKITPDTTVVTKPVPPVGLKVVETFADKVHLKWDDAQKNISYYIIDVSPKVNGFPARTESRAVTVQKLTPETRYQFMVKAVNTSADESAFSKPVEATTSGKPNAPEGVVIKIDSTSHTNYGYGKTVEITWRPTLGADMYFVYKNEEKLSPPVDVTKYREDYSKLEKGTEHVYSISSYNSAGESAQRSVSILTEPPTPAIIKIDNQSNSFSIEWDRVPSAQKYYVRHIGAYTDRVKSVDSLIPVLGTTYERKNLPYSSTFRYCVMAENRAGKSACSEEIVIETSIAPPEITKVDPGADSVRISWRGSDGAAYYDIYRRNEGERDETKIGSTKPASNYNNYYYSASGAGSPKTEWFDKSIEPKKQYYYSVAAIDKKGNESMSKAYSHKTSAVGTLVLKNENNAGGIITGYKITSGSETIANVSLLNIRPDQDEPHSRSLIVDANGTKNYEIQITSSSRARIEPVKFKIIENKETTLIYRVSLLVQEQPK